jgi:DNA-binding NarL/FixJ family response regulator
LTARGDPAKKLSGHLVGSPDAKIALGGRPPSSETRLRVLLADDHEVVRQGLKGILREESDREIVGAAANGREVVDLAWRLRPDVVIMGVSMPLINGDEATRQIKGHLPQTRVIALLMHAEHERVDAMSTASVEAYVLKAAPSEELLAAIRGKKPAPPKESA